MRIPRQINYEFPIHVTGRSNNREAFPLPLTDVWEICCDYLFLLNIGFGIRILSFVVMPNHFHLMLLAPNENLPEAMAYFMRETSKEMGRRTRKINHQWGNRFHSSVIGSPLYFLHAYKYVYRNPVKAGLASSVVEYPFSSLSILLGKKIGILPMEFDATLFEDVESTTKWLNEDYGESAVTAIRKALRKKNFEFAIDPSNRNLSPLASWDSVPFSLRNYQK